LKEIRILARSQDMRCRFCLILIFALAGYCSLRAQEKKAEVDPFLTACQEGNLQVVERLLDGPRDLEIRDARMGWTPLMWAANNGHPAVARVLLDHGALVNAKDIAGQTPLKLVIRQGSSEGLQLLLDRGADVFVLGKMGDTLLSEAVLVGNSEAVVALLERGVNVNAANSFGSTPLLVAALSSRAGIAAILLEAGADLNARNKAGSTALSLAVQSVLPRRSFWQDHKYDEATQTVKVLLRYGAKVDDNSRTVARENHMKDISKLFQSH
jgi:ankyrin repeat protein